MFGKIPQSTIIARHNKLDPDFDGPTIGVCFDWRKTSSGERCYIAFIYKRVKEAIERGGGRIYILKFSDRYDDVKHIIDGMLIPGGRDFDPATYGKENKGSNFD